MRIAADYRDRNLASVDSVRPDENFPGAVERPSPTAEAV